MTAFPLNKPDPEPKKEIDLTAPVNPSSSEKAKNLENVEIPPETELAKYDSAEMQAAFAKLNAAEETVAKKRARLPVKWIVVAACIMALAPLLILNVMK